MKNTNAFLSPADYVDPAMPQKPPSPNPDYRPSGEEERERLYSGYGARVAAWQAACEERSKAIAIARDIVQRKRSRIARGR